MSIFSLYEDDTLSGDKSRRYLKNDVLEYSQFTSKNVGEAVFQKKRKIMWLPYIFCLIVGLLLVGQLVKLQITQGGIHRTLAEGNRLRVREIPAPRGLIYDSTGALLAKNNASYNLEIYPLDLPKNQDERNDIFTKLANTAQIPETEIIAKVNEKGLSTYDPIVLKENIDRETAMVLEVRTANLSGVSVSKKPMREYENIRGLGPIIGYVGKLNDVELTKNPTYKTYYEIGKDGLELNYENYLKGIPGVSEIEVDSRGRQQRRLSVTNPQPGNNLILSLETGLQEKMAQSLSGMLYQTNSPGGVAIALDPRNGQILGMVSFPTFDNNLFSRNTAGTEYQTLLDDSNNPMFNRAVAGTYPSGSIIKPYVAAAGLQEETITAQTTINDPGEIKVGNYVYPDWKAHGYVDVRKAIAVSCNDFFYAVAGGWDKIRGLGVDKLKSYLVKFGFGSKSGIDLPNEAAGLVPDPAWKEKYKKETWYLGDTYHMGIGQGDLLVTPLQMALATATIANGGELLKPKLVSKITDKDGNTIYSAQKEIIRSDMASKENIQIVREGMRLTVTGGSGTLLQDLPVAAAAKTGTAQFGSEGKTHGWLTVFAPYNDPQIALVVLVEAGGEGYATAGPVAKDILNWYFSHH